VLHERKLPSNYGCRWGQLELGQKHNPTEPVPDFFWRWGRTALTQALRQVRPHEVLGWVDNFRHQSLRNGRAMFRHGECLVPILEATG